MASPWPPDDADVPAALQRLAVVYRATSPLLAPLSASRAAEATKETFVRNVRSKVLASPMSLDELGDACHAVVEDLRPDARDSESTELLDHIATACVAVPTAEDPFEVLMDPIRSQARALYESSESVDLSLGPLSTDPDRTHHPERVSVAPPFVLSAGTFWAADVPRVHLAIDPEDFEPATFAVVPYVLAHEVVCHAFTGHLDGHREPRPGSIMAEGLMDWAAQWFCDTWLHLMPHGCAVDARVHQSAFQTQTHAGRRARSRGHHAAHVLSDFLAAQGVPEPEAFARVAHAAIALNAADLPLEDKDLVVTRWIGIDSNADLSARVSRWSGEPDADVMDMLL